MKRLATGFMIGLSCVAALALSGCGAGSEDDVDEDGAEFATDSDGFDESQLPADFPRELIPPEYDVGNYTQLGSMEGASFENGEPVGETIDYYVTLLGEPTLDVESGDGGRTAQWHETGRWVVGVVGNESESIIGVTRNPNEAQ